MVSNFGVSFKLGDIREVREQCIGSSLSSSKGPLPEEETPNDHKLLQTLLSSNGRPNKRSGGLSVARPIESAKEQQALAAIRQASPTVDTVYE